MPLSAEFSVEGVSSVTAHEVAYGDTVDLALLSDNGVNVVEWTIAGTSHASFSAPTITPAGSPSGKTASFAMPADPGGGEGRSVLVKCVVTDSALDRAVAYRVVGVPNDVGTVPIAAGEENHRSATHGWIEPVNAALAGITPGSGGVSAPANPADDGKLAVASAGDLTYLGGSAVGQVPRWTGSGAAWGALDLADSDARTGTLPIGSGGTGLTSVGSSGTVCTSNGSANVYAQITNSHVDASAAIAGTKISPNFGNQTLLQTETASATTSPSAGQGGWWTRNSVPSLPMFTGDTGIEHNLGPVEPINTSSSASNNLTLSNFGKFNVYSNASATLLVQDDSDVDFPNGTIINGYYSGSGTLTIQEDASNNVTPTPDGKTLVVQAKGVFALRKVAANDWILLGALV